MEPFIMVYDTESTGLPLWGTPSDDPRQPHLVQLAACVANTETREVLSSMNTIIRPDGWVIPDEIAKIHGITTERAMDEGEDEEYVLDWFVDQFWQGRPRVGHNESFDALIIRIGLKRFKTLELADRWKASPAECTARLSTSACDLPPTQKMIQAGRNQPKTPTLAEAYRILCGKELENAHDAEADVHATLAVYWALKDLEPTPIRKPRRKRAHGG